MITLFGKPEPTLLERLKESVGKTRTELSARVEQLLTGNRPVDPELLKQLESALLSADIGVRTTKEVLAALREQVNEHKIDDAGQLKQELKRQILKILEAPAANSDGKARDAAARAVRCGSERHRENHDDRQTCESSEERRRERHPLRCGYVSRGGASNNWKCGRAARASKW